RAPTKEAGSLRLGTARIASRDLHARCLERSCRVFRGKAELVVIVRSVWCQRVEKSAELFRDQQRFTFRRLVIPKVDTALMRTEHGQKNHLAARIASNG